VIALLLDKYLIPDPELFALYFEEGELEDIEETLFARAKEIITKRIMVIPITKQRLTNCLVAFMFVAVFNSLMYMVVNALWPKQPFIAFHELDLFQCKSSCTNAALPIEPLELRKTVLPSILHKALS
jgi:hypothetical protein